MTFNHESITLTKLDGQSDRFLGEFLFHNLPFYEIITYYNKKGLRIYYTNNVLPADAGTVQFILW